MFSGLKKLFEKRGIDLDWVLYKDWDALVDAYVNREIDMAWHGPLSYVKAKRRMDDPGQVVAMRDFDVNFATQFITQPDSDILTVEDLRGKSFALGSRGSVQAGLLAYHFLKQAGIDPRRDLLKFTFHEERDARPGPDEQDVIERVRSGEYDAGAVSKNSLETLEAKGSLPKGSIRVFYTPPSYSHCCFAAQSGMDQDLAARITEAFLSIDDSTPEGKAVLEGEHCQAFVPGSLEGWEALEEAAEAEGLI